MARGNGLPILTLDPPIAAADANPIAAAAAAADGLGDLSLAELKLNCAREERARRASSGIRKTWSNQRSGRHRYRKSRPPDRLARAL